MFEVFLSLKAHKFYETAPEKLVKKMNLALDVICKNPFSGKNIKILRGNLEGLYRYKIGDYRIIYSIDKKIKIISIIWIGNRKQAYKK